MPNGAVRPSSIGNTTCAQAELSEEAHLAGGAWHPLLPEGHPGFAEIKWGRCAPALLFSLSVLLRCLSPLAVVAGGVA